MVSAHMLNKTSLSKLMFKVVFQFCSTIVILQTLVKKPFKQLYKIVKSRVSTIFLLKQLVVDYYCFF